MALAGKNANMTFTGITVEIQGWTLEYAADMLETTAFSDAGVERSIVGIKRWTATATGPVVDTNTADVGDSATLTLFAAAGGVNWTGTAWLESIGDAAPVEGVVQRTYNFKGNGALTPIS